jgi:Na+-driven multidrug efflux pump
MSERLRDAYIGAEKDSAERKQARFIVRSITVISITIGIIFTSIWYLFPGQFISYRGATQPQDAVDVVQPEDSDNDPL